MAFNKEENNPEPGTDTGFDSVFSDESGFNDESRAKIKSFIEAADKVREEKFKAETENKSKEAVKEAEAAVKKAQEAADKEFADFINGEGKDGIAKFFNNAKNREEMIAKLKETGLDKDLKTAKLLSEFGKNFVFDNGTQLPPKGEAAPKEDWYDKVLVKSGITVKN